MKKLLFFATVLCLGFTSVAQEDSAFTKELKDFVEVQSGANIDAALTQVMPMIPEAKREDFKKELKSEMKGMYGEIAEIYIEKVGKEDLNKMLEFYKTPAGKNILEKTPDVIEASMSLNQKYMMKLQPLIQKYMGQ